MDTRNKRLYLLDAYRGFVILVMTAFHFCFDYFVIFKGNWGWPRLTPVFIWEQYICWSFNLLSGFVWNYGRKNCIRRGVIVNICGLAVTFVTFLIMPDTPILYGVLTFLGCAMIIMLPLSKLLDRLPAVSVLICSFCLFLLTFSVPNGGLGIYNHMIIPLPRQLYRSRLLTPLGFPHPGFVSSDYFPLIPWIFLYICGYALNRLLSSNRRFIRFASLRIPPLEFLGRHSLLSYMLHQPLCYLVCMLLFA
ncbi:MAG: DUF1624 domain-containing protein [Lachnospiraceae bacterium]|nr:DUF1624 domain-containing protein [Lachnospiraceae bacterium]